MNKIKEGYLTKEGGSVKTWKRRWFVLNERELIYTRAQEDYEVLGKVYVADMKRVERIDLKGRVHCFCLQVSNPSAGVSRSFHISADSAADMEAWIATFLTLPGITSSPSPSSPATSSPIASSSPSAATTAASYSSSPVSSALAAFSSSPSAGSSRSFSPKPAAASPTFNNSSSASSSSRALPPKTPASPTTTGTKPALVSQVTLKPTGQKLASSSGSTPGSKPGISTSATKPPPVAAASGTSLRRQPSAPELSKVKAATVNVGRSNSTKAPAKPPMNETRAPPPSKLGATPPAARPSPKPGVLTTHTVLFPYEAPTKEELTIAVGDEITFIREEGEWIEGEINDASGTRKGWFPASYVKKKPSTGGSTRVVSPTPAFVPKATSPVGGSAPAKPSKNTSQPFAELTGYEKRKDTVTKEAFYLFVIKTEQPQKSTIYRRLSEFRALYIRLLERYPSSGLPELPVLKEGLFTVYSSLLEQLVSFFDALMEMSDEILSSAILQDFLLETQNDRVYQSTTNQIVSSESADRTKRSTSPPPTTTMAPATATTTVAPSEKSTPKAPVKATPPARVFEKYTGTPRSLSATIIGLIKVGTGVRRHYEYEIDVIRDGERYTILRRYSEFHALQVALIEKFPVEGGVNDPAQRVLPFIPGKVLFGRSQTHDVANLRVPELNAYVKDLLSLGPKISTCPEVVEFFSEMEKDVLGIEMDPGTTKRRGLPPLEIEANGRPTSPPLLSPPLLSSNSGWD